MICVISSSKDHTASNGHTSLVVEFRWNFFFHCCFRSIFEPKPFHRCHTLNQRRKKTYFTSSITHTMSTFDTRHVKFSNKWKKQKQIRSDISYSNLVKDFTIWDHEWIIQIYLLRQRSVDIYVCFTRCLCTYIYIHTLWAVAFFKFFS